MSTTGRRSLPQPTWKAKRAILQAPAKRGDIEGAIRRMMKVVRAIGSHSQPPSEERLRDMCERHVRRSHDPAGGARQLLAIAASDDRTKTVRRVKAPTLVIHGDEDPLIPPGCGLETAHVIREGGGRAEVVVIPGMGHDFPEKLVDRIVDEIAAHCRASC